MYDRLVSYRQCMIIIIVSQELYDRGLCINLPEEGEFITWKVDIDKRGDELRPILIQLRIPKDAKRLTPYYLQGQKGNYTCGCVDSAVVEKNN